MKLYDILHLNILQIEFLLKKLHCFEEIRYCGITVCWGFVFSINILKYTYLCKNLISPLFRLPIKALVPNFLYFPLTADSGEIFQLFSAYKWRGIPVKILSNQILAFNDVTILKDGIPVGSLVLYPYRKGANTEITERLRLMESAPHKNRLERHKLEKEYILHPPMV